MDFFCVALHSKYSSLRHWIFFNSEMTRGVNGWPFVFSIWWLYIVNVLGHWVFENWPQALVACKRDERARKRRYHAERVYIYIYIHTCIYIYMYVCMHVYTYIYIHIYVYTHTHTQTHTHTHIICTCVYVCICVYLSIYLYVHMYRHKCQEAADFARPGAKTQTKPKPKLNLISGGRWVRASWNKTQNGICTTAERRCLRTAGPK